MECPTFLLNFPWPVTCDLWPITCNLSLVPASRASCFNIHMYQRSTSVTAFLCEHSDQYHLNHRAWKELIDSLNHLPLINPLTPVPPVTARDEPWPFFHFWRHHFWPNLASSILNFYRRKRAFQWCLVHSDWLIGTSNMPKMFKKLSKKLAAKFPATTPSCSMVKIGHLDDSSWNLF